jgi:hypothetical protein
VEQHLGVIQASAENRAHNLVIVLPEHTLLESNWRFYSETPEIGAPRNTVHRVRVDNHAIEIENERQIPRTGYSTYTIPKWNHITDLERVCMFFADSPLVGSRHCVCAAPHVWGQKSSNLF